MCVGDTQHILDVPVLIVGGGPTGLLTAYMLSAHGVKSLLIEKYPERLAAPKAHALSPRSLEICRQYDLDTNALRKLGAPRDEARWVNFLTTLSGEQIGRLPYERMDAAVLDDTPEMIHNIPQPEFEHFVAKQLAHDSNVEIRKGVGFVTCEQHGNTVITTVQERATRTKWQVRSQYVIACDGAKSQVRHSLGIETEGETGYETMMTIHFKADLKPVVGCRLGMLHWILDPACSGFIISYDMGGNQVLISNFDSTKHPADTWTEDLARNTVTAAIGKEIDFELLSYRPWLLSRKVAKRYQCGNVFLAGDAAHSFPPTGGLGLNSGLADAHNLACKLAAVYHGQARSSTLANYETERRPIALINSAQSVKNGKKIFSFLKAVGTADFDDHDKARQNMLQTIHDPSNHEDIARHVEGQREHFDNLEIHIGYVYPHATPPSNASDYKPKFQAGARLPHGWIKPATSSTALPKQPVDTSYIHEFTADDIHARRWSTLDLLAPGSFTVVAGRQVVWEERFAALQEAIKPWNLCLRLWAADSDFEFTDRKHRELFDESVDFGRNGAILVRSDQHILGCMDETTTVQDMVSLIQKDTALCIA